MFARVFLDIDECKDGDVCMNGRCVNEPGGYRCLCDRGYSASPDGKTCLGEIRNIESF